MKANYKVIANKQKILEKEIENFEPTSTMSVLLMRYSIIQGLLQVKLNEKDAKGDDSEKTKPKGWTSATPQNRRS